MIENDDQWLEKMNNNRKQRTMTANDEQWLKMMDDDLHDDEQ